MKLCPGCGGDDKYVNDCGTCSGTGILSKRQCNLCSGPVTYGLRCDACNYGASPEWQAWRDALTARWSRCRGIAIEGRLFETGPSYDRRARELDSDIDRAFRKADLDGAAHWLGILENRLGGAS